MDPKANIEEQLQLANEILDPEHADCFGSAAERLAELVTALDAWRIMGGYDPYTARSATRQENAALALLRAAQAELVTLVARLDQPAQRNVRALLDQIKATLGAP